MSPIGRPAEAVPLPKTNGNSHSVNASLPTNGIQKRPSSGPTTGDLPTKIQCPEDMRIMAILESASSPFNDSPVSSKPSTLIHPDPDEPPRKRAVGRPPNPENVGFKKPAAAQKNIKKAARKNRPVVSTNGMPSAHSKVNFRARALDPLRQMPVHLVRNDEANGNSMNLELLCDNKVIKKPMFSVPSGMEKEEERELHLRRAIEAQRAQTTGISVVDQHIPIRQVETLTEEQYKQRTHWRKQQKVEGYHELELGDFDFCDDDTSYDADEQDFEWLQTNNSIVSLDEFEFLIEKLEVLAQGRVPELEEFLQKHPEVELAVAEKVFDYWLSKKMQAVRALRMNAGLVPLVPSKPRPGEKDNPYIAFRHRGPRVTTRRKQKVETEHYGTMLRLAAGMRRTHLLTKIIVKREKVKVRMTEAEENEFDGYLSYLKGGGAVDWLNEKEKTMPDNEALSWLPKLWHNVVNYVLDNSSSDLWSYALDHVTMTGSRDGHFAFNKQATCFYRSVVPQPNTIAANLLEPKSPICPNWAGPPRVDDLLDLTKMSVVQPHEMKQLTGVEVPVLARLRQGRSGRLSLDFTLPST